MYLAIDGRPHAPIHLPRNSHPSLSRYWVAKFRGLPQEKVITNENNHSFIRVGGDGDELGAGGGPVCGADRQ